MNNVYTFRCMVCGLEYVSDGHTFPCGKCRRWTKQECTRQPAGNGTRTWTVVG